MIEGQSIAHWLSRLVQMPSVAVEQGGNGEEALAAQVAAWFAELGGDVHLHEVLPGRSNVYGLWRGQAPRWLAVDVHMDTVGVRQMAGDPFDGRVENGRVYGRGAVDTKATLALVLALLADAQQRRVRLPNNILIAATVDEEFGATGAPAFAAWLAETEIEPLQLIVAEPTLCVPVHGHKGVCRLTCRVAGKAAHSSQPALGANAITAAARAILALDAEQERLQARPATSALGRPQLTVATVQGGSGINVVPDRCTFSIDRRIVDGEDPQQVYHELVALARTASSLPLSAEQQLLIPAFLQSPDTPWLRQFSAWCDAEPQVAPYGTNAWAYVGMETECLVFGPGSIDQAHSADEWIAIDELEKAAGVYARWWGLVA